LLETITKTRLLDIVIGYCCLVAVHYMNKCYQLHQIHLCYQGFSSLIISHQFNVPSKIKNSRQKIKLKFFNLNNYILFNF